MFSLRALSARLINFIFRAYDEAYDSDTIVCTHFQLGQLGSCIARRIKYYIRLCEIQVGML